MSPEFIVNLINVSIEGSKIGCITLIFLFLIAWEAVVSLVGDFTFIRSLVFEQACINDFVKS